jgi:uncharacterized protein YndB with AHSA1/START domain
MTDRLTFEIEVEIDAPADAVWNAVSTSNGISAWMLPTEIEEHVGGSVVFHMGDTDSKGTVLAFEAPHRIVYEEPDWAALAGHAGETVTPMVTEFVVEARSGGSCVVTVVSSAFGTGADWEKEFFAEMGKGWAPSFEVLKLYAERHAGLLSTGFEIVAEHPVSQVALRAYFDRAGDLGAIERSGDDYVLVGLADPVPGCVLLACLGEQGGSSVARVAGYLYGPDGPAAVDGVREQVDRWLRGVAPA